MSTKVQKKTGARKRTPREKAPKKKAEPEKKKAKNKLIRAITVPVACPVGCEWRDVRPTIRASFDQSLSVHNWIVRQLVRLDSAPPHLDKQGRPKLPPMPELPGKRGSGEESLYQQARKIATLLNSGTVSQIVRDVLRRYKGNRLAVFQGRRSLDCYRSAPIPVRKQEIEKNPVRDEGGVLTVGFPFSDPTTGKVVHTRWKLAGGRRYARSLRGIRAALQGKSDMRCLYLIEQRVAGKPPRLMCKVVVVLSEAPPDPEARGDLLVATGPEGLLRYASGGVYSRGRNTGSWLRYDHVPRLLAQRRKLNRRMSDDMTRERRQPKRKRQRMVAANKVRLGKLSRALDDAVKCAAKEVVGVATRRRSKRIVYRDDPRGYASGFQWFKLRERVQDLCLEHGLEFVHDEEGAMVPDAFEATEETVDNLVKEHIAVRSGRHDEVDLKAN